MAKKLAVIILSVLVLSAIVIAVFYINRQTSFVATSAMNAVPVNSALIVESYHYTDLVTSLRTANEMYNELLNIGLIKRIDKQFGVFDSLLKTDKRARNFITGNSLITAAVLTGKNKFDFLYLVSFAGNSQYEDAEAMVTELLKGKAVITSRNYNKTEISEARIKNTNIIFNYSFTNGVFILSFSSILVEQAILHLSSDNPLTKNKTFIKIASTAGKNASANIYINHKTFPQLLSIFSADDLKKSILLANAYAGWTELDATVHTDELLLNGFTFTSDSIYNYINIFLDQTPSRTNVESVLPSSTGTFAGFCISNYREFSRKYRNYLEQEGRITAFSSAIDEINHEYNIDIESLFASFFDTEIAMAFTDIAPESPAENAFAVILTKSSSLAKDALFKILEKFAAKRKSDIRTLTQNYKIDKETSFPIYQMPVENLTSRLFGELFDDIKTKYFTFIDNYLVFGPSVKALSEFIHENVLQKTLKNDLNYSDFADKFCSKSNFYLYSTIGASLPLYNKLLNPDLQKYLKINKDIFRKFQAFAFQFRSDNKKDMVYNDLIIKYNPVIKEKPRTVWESRLDTTVGMKPRLLQSSETGEKEIMVQDMANKLYLINNVGRIMWKKQLSEPLMSDIYQIDYSGNGKLQYLFSTRKAIYLIDHNGNDVGRYPVKLSSPATNGLALFDYDKNKDYRMFIACEDKKIYAFTKEGKSLDGWEFTKTENKVTTELQFFRVSNKDYIVFADKHKVYMLDRKGKQRVNVNASFTKSARNNFILDNNVFNPRLVTTDTTGKVWFVYFTGKTESLDIMSCSSGHYFDYQDVNGDNIRDFIFADKNKLTVISKKKKLFEYQCKDNINDRPSFYQFSNSSRKIGIVSKNAGEIYLFNADGTMYKGFPLQGNTMFSIGMVSDSPKFNLFVGSNDKFLYNYEIQ
ncbi:MAG: hypothetical protein NTW49_06690 [Bacteroidia bacterium]|nr:hypothetical protein [Bacteroidia bacterium]